MVADIPETQYVRSADGTKIAFQVIGDGPLDLFFLPGLGIPLDLLWDEPGLVRVRKRLGTFSRAIWFEPRGIGASEGSFTPSEADAYFGHSNDDIRAVLDVIGSGRVALVGAGFSGPQLIDFAVAHPARVRALVLINSFAYYGRDADYPYGLSSTVVERIVASMKENWGTGADLEVMAPSRVADQRFRAWWTRGERLGGGPDNTAERFREMYSRDLRPFLASVRAPTLVAHREGSRLFRIGAGRYLADHIPDAKLVVLPGDDFLFFVGDTDALFDEVEEFLTGARIGAEADLLVSVIMFTDVVASTEQQARVGQREWSRLTDHHDALVRAALLRHRGQEVKTTGDGFLATFDAATSSIRCATEILKEAKDAGLVVRAGVHAGEVEVRGDDVAGLAVSIGKRVCDLAGPCQVLATETVRSLIVGSPIAFEDRGEHDLKGVPGTWRLFAVSD